MTDANILVGLASEYEFAMANGITQRTVERYRNRANGLPWVMFGGRIFIPIDDASTWLKNQTRNPNKRRVR